MIHRKAMQKAVVILVLASGAFAHPPGLTPVQAAYDDVNPLAHSLIMQPYDMRAPMNFDTVYRVDPNFQFFGKGSGDYYARVHGGLMWIFPRSVYRPMKEGLKTKVPPGAVLVLGLPGMGVPAWVKPPPDESDTRVLAPIDLRVNEPLSTDPRTEAKGEARTMWTSEACRRQRIMARLDECR